MQPSSSESGNFQKNGILVHLISITMSYLMGFISLVRRLLRASKGLVTLDRIAIEKLKQQFWLRLLSALGLKPHKYHPPSPFLMTIVGDNTGI